ncbi:MAG: hypothetical protein LBD24_04000 [Spirochaetaceae bacterium]|nr:hypothetical protein [Spirochaetaceae bacterium]
MFPNLKNVLLGHPVYLLGHPVYLLRQKVYLLRRRRSGTAAPFIRIIPPIIRFYLPKHP